MTDVSLIDLDGRTVFQGTQVGGGGSQPGVAIVRGPFSFAFNTAGLNNGIPIGYTPAIGDVLLDAWFEIDTAFDGTTPTADIGTFNGSNTGLFVVDNNAPTLDSQDTEISGLSTSAALLTDLLSNNITLVNPAISFRVVPASFRAADPLKLVVSQNGHKGGTAIGGTAGAARLYIVTATPTAFT